MRPTEHLEPRVLFASWSAIEQINHSYGSGRLNGGVDIAVSPTTGLPYVVMHSNTSGTNDYVIQVNKPTRRPDGTLDWSGTRNTPLEATPRGYKNQNPSVAVGTLSGQEQVHVVFFEHDGGSANGAAASEDIMYARSTNGGTTWSAPLNISQQAAGDSPRVGTDPAIAADDMGNVYVVWSSWGGNANQNQLDIWFHKFNGSTQTWEAKKKIESNTATKSAFPQIFWVPGTGRIHVAWGDRGVSPPPVSYTTSNDYGTTFTAPQAVFTAPSPWDVRGVTITETADGTVIAAAQITDPANSRNKNTHMAYKSPGSGTWSAIDSISGTSPSGDPHFTADRSGRTYFSWIKNPYPDTGYEFNFRYRDGADALNFDTAINQQVSSDGLKKDSGHIAVDLRATVSTDVFAAWEGNPGTHQVYASMTNLQPPTADVIDVAPDPRTTGVPSIAVNFSEHVIGVDLADLRLTRNGATVPLTGATLSTADNKTYTLGNLTSLTGSAGEYTLSVIAAGSGIVDVFANTLAADASDMWTFSDPPPVVTQVYVAGSAWTQAYRNSLAASGEGDATYGYRVKSFEQGLTLGWSNLNQVSIRFSEHVNINTNDLALTGVNAGYGLAPLDSFNYDPFTFTATWTLNRAIPNDKITISLDDAITDTNGVPLDGEWNNPTFPSWFGDAFPSGNGSAGGDFLFSLRVLPGDLNRDGAVSVYDYNALRSNLTRSGVGLASGDVNGDGVVNFLDFNDLRTYMSRTSPA